MRKHILAVFAIITTLCLTACGGNSNNKEEADISVAEESSVQSEMAFSDEDVLEAQEDKLFQNGLLAVKIGDKWGYIDETGVYAINPQFDEARQFNKDGSAIVCIDANINEDGKIESGKYGLIDKKGNYILEPQYDFIGDFDDSGLAVIGVSDLRSDENGFLYNGTDSRYGYIDTKGNIIVALQQQWLSGNPSDLIIIKLNDKEGFADKNGRIIIEPQFDDVGEFAENGLAYAMLNGKYGFIDKTGNYVIEPKFDDALGFAVNGLAAVCENDICGYIDISGDYVIKPQFEFAENFTENGIAGVWLNNKFGIIDENCQYILNPQFDYTFHYDKFTEVELNGKYGALDKYGKIIIEPMYDYIMKLTDDLILVSMNNKYGIVNLNGDYIIDTVLDYIQQIDDDLVEIQSDGKYGIICDGKLISEPKFDGISDRFSSNGLMSVVINDKFGYIDKTGSIVIEAKFDDAYDFFSSDLACVEIDGKYGYIDKTGEIIIESVFEDAYPFHKSGYTWVATEYKTGIIDQSGNFILEWDNEEYDVEIYDELFYFPLFSNCDLAPMCVDEKCGLINKNGDFVIEPQYDYIYSLKDSDYILLVISISDGDFLYGFADSKGKIICNPQFNDFDYEKVYAPNMIEYEEVFK